MAEAPKNGARKVIFINEVDFNKINFIFCNGKNRRENIVNVTRSLETEHF